MVAITSSYRSHRKELSPVTNRFLNRIHLDGKKGDRKHSHQIFHLKTKTSLPNIRPKQATLTLHTKPENKHIHCSTSPPGETKMCRRKRTPSHTGHSLNLALFSNAQQQHPLGKTLATTTSTNHKRENSFQYDSRISIISVWIP